MPEHTVVPTRVRLLAVLMVIALGAVSYSIWTSPLARRTAQKILTAPLPAHGGFTAADSSLPPQDAAVEAVSRSRRAATASSDPESVAKLRAQVAALRSRIDQPRPVVDSGSGGGDHAGAAAPDADQPSGRADHGSVPAGSKTPAKPKGCQTYSWQQDAQAAYLANLADPSGLDGPPGPNDDDGIACADLPVDPSRPRSVPAGAKVEAKPATPALADLLHPDSRFYGLYTEQSPFNWSEVDSVSRLVGKVPSMAGYFGSGDEAFRAGAVVSSWRRGMLPLLTWELRPKADMGPGGGQAVRPGYSLADIATGSLDTYLTTYAHQVAALGLPMAIRLDHEMNGSWYPWSIYTQVNGRDGRTGAEWYRLMWQHVHDIFTRAGATNVIWVWSPNIITWSRSDFRNFYPGDDYVDWIGLSGYYRRTSEQPTFDATYGPTLRKLRNQTLFPHAAKPILLSEIGATENGGSKVTWINDLFASFAKPENADLVGFCWFNNIVTSSPGDPSAVTNDWRIRSSKAAVAAFAAGIASADFAPGR
jgi:mannan endo-1,4-beta-mannosidase